MYQEFYEGGGTLLALPITTLILFIAVFAVVVVREWRHGSDNTQHAHLGALPLEPDHFEPDHSEPEHFAAGHSHADEAERARSATEGGSDRG